jgi:hypothetical protein
MSDINSQSSLREAILLLEKQQTEQGKALKDTVLEAYESIQPINIIKKTFKAVNDSPILKDGLLSTSIGWAMGFFSERFFENKTLNPIKKILGTALIFGITNVVERNPDTFKNIGIILLNFIKHKLLKNTATPKNDQTEANID